MINLRQISVWLFLMISTSLTWAIPTGKSPGKINIPPSAELFYTVTAQYNGLDIIGNSSIRWKTGKASYSLKTETRVSLLGKILDTNSIGKIRSKGLMPEEYTEKRIRKTQTKTTFNRTKNIIYFPENKSSPMKELTQDRASIVWQLSSIARANPNHFKINSQWTFDVAGRSKISSWIFRVIKIDNLSTPIGSIKTIQLTRASTNDQEVSVWLAPAYNWYPVQILLIEHDGLQIKQTIKKIIPIQ